jgi:hypothetical protein
LCLAENNYVLRFGLAEALAGAVEKDLLPLDEVLRLVRLDRKLNEFELGGYAFKALASRRPNLARDHGEQLQVLARHKCYPGRSILGDLMLNLVYQGEMPSQLLPIETAQDFWRPCWCFVEYDVLAIRAAELDRGGGLHEPALCDDIAALGRLKEWRDQARTHLEAYPSLAFVVDNVFTIGSQTNKIKDARDEIAAIADSELILTVLRLFFGHPLWSVAESMASVLSELHRLQPGSGRYRNLIHQMFDEPDWRVRYGAVEAAFQIRQTEKNTTFFEAVDRFHDDRNKKLRGLCAENLFAIMLNQSDSERIGLERLFEAKIRVWLKDDDCWVLEHVYRYLNALHQRFGASPNQAKSGKVPFVDGPTSPLLEDLPDWWALDRETVLRHIDCAKRKARKGGGKG